MENTTLTDRQRLLLDLVQLGREVNGFAPSGEELADSMGISVQGVFWKIKALTKKGLLTRTVGVHRSMRLTPAALVLLGK